MRACVLILGLLFAQVSVARMPAAVEQVFGTPPSAQAQAWLDDAVDAYNTKMAALERDWLADVKGARTDLRRRQVIFETGQGRVVFDARVIGGYVRKDDQWLWSWGWAGSFVASNFWLPSSALDEVAKTLGLPFLTTAAF